MSLVNVIKDLNKLRVGRQQRLIESSRLLTLGDSIDICRHISFQWKLNKLLLNNKNADSINKVKSLIDNWDSNKLGFAGKRRLELCLKELQKVN